MWSRRSGLGMVEQDFQLRRARSQVDIPTGTHHGSHVIYDCPACEDPWVGKIYRSRSSSELYPIRRPIVSPPIAKPQDAAKWYTNVYKTPWYDRSRQYHWDGGYMSPRRYYPSHLGGYTYISSPLAPQLFYPNDWYHKFRSIPVGTEVGRPSPYSTSAWDYDYLPTSALTHSDGLYERGPARAFGSWASGRLDYSTLDRYWLGRESLYRKLSLSNRQPHSYLDYPFGAYAAGRPWHYYR